MNHIGNSYPIHDARAKVAGRAIYTGDMELQNMLHMALIFSTIPHGRVKNINCEKALQLDGVVDIVHCFNTPHNTYSRYQVQFGDKLVRTERIFTDHVRFVGDRIGGIIAKTEEIARKAVELVEIEYEIYPYSLSIDETLTGVIDNVYEDGPIFLADTISVGELNNRNDLIEVETTANIARISHTCMETHACIAKYEPYSGELEIYSPNQSVFAIRVLINKVFGISCDKVRVVKNTMGGSFGAKQEWILEPAVVAAAMKTGRAVRLIFNRKETMISTMCRAPLQSKIKVSYTPEGKIANINSDVLLDSGAYLGSSDDYAYTIGTKFSKLYKSDSIHCTGKAITTNTTTAGGFRGWAAPEATIIMERNINVAAKIFNIDPVEFRLQNLLPPQSIDIKTGLNVGDLQSKKTIELGRDMFDWYNRKAEVAEFNDNNTRYKRGIATSACGHVSGRVPNHEFARIDMRVTESGTVMCNATVHDHGCGTITAFKMIIAEVLGMDIDDIKIKEGDTDYTPYDIGCYSSRTISVIGRATYECAVKLKERIKYHFADLEGINIADVEVDGKHIYQKSNTSNGYSLTDLVNKSQKIRNGEIFASYEHTAHTNALVCGAHFAMVEVDRYTGMTKVLDYVAVHDIGKAINKEMCVAQTQGAVIQGIGAALTEHIKYRKNGIPFGSLKDYHVINSAEAPNVRVAFVEEGIAEGPYNAKSIGEACHVPVAAAVMCAVNNAIDSDIDTIPMTPDVILAYLEKKGV